MKGLKNVFLVVVDVSHPNIKLKRKVLFRKKDIDEFLESKLVK